jgi:ABC-type lipoprotein release transport system permease subunit
MRQWIEKQRNILDYTLSALLRRKAKYIGLSLVYTSIVFGLASVMFFAEAMKKEASIILKDAPEMVVQRIVAGRHDLIPLDYAEEISRIRGVSSVRGRLWGYYYDPVIAANYTLMAPENLELGEQNIAIGEGIARSRDLATGEQLHLRAHDGTSLPFLIRGILAPESGLISADLVLITGSDFRKLFGIDNDRATDLSVKVLNKKEIPTIRAKIAELFPDARIILKSEILNTYEAVFDWRGGIMLVILSGALLAFAIFAWDKASGLSAEERREIGILKAIGWESADILQMKFWEGMVVSLSSFLLGLLLAYFHVFFTSASLLEPVLKGWSSLYPRFHLAPFIGLYQIATLFILVVAPYTSATIVPAWRAAIIDPDQAMRS